MALAPPPIRLVPRDRQQLLPALRPQLLARLSQELELGARQRRRVARDVPDEEVPHAGGGQRRRGGGHFALRWGCSALFSRCLYEACGAAAAWGCPRAFCVRPCLAACVVGHYLAYKTTRLSRYRSASVQEEAMIKLKQSNRH